MRFSQYKTRHCWEFLSIIFLILISFSLIWAIEKPTKCQIESYIKEVSLNYPFSPQQSPMNHGSGSGNNESKVIIGNQFSGSGTTYYVDATNGSDANNGLTPEKAWKTIYMVNNSIFTPGDSILFKRGETWRERLTVPTSGSAGNPITFRAYGTGARPIILGSIAKNNAGDWTLDASTGQANTWSTTAAVATKTVFRDKGAGFTVMTRVANKADLDADGEWWYDDPNDKVFVYAVANPISGGVKFEIPQRTNAITGALSVDYLTISNLSIHYCIRSGIMLDTGMNNWVISDNTITQNGGSGIRSQNNSNVLISGNTVSYVGINDASDTTEIAGIFLATSTGGTISRNIVSYTGRAGILVYGEGSDNVIVEHNTVHDAGQNGAIDGHAYGIQLFGPETGDQNGGIVRYNYVYDCGHANLYIINRVTNAQVYYNILVNGGSWGSGDYLGNISFNGDSKDATALAIYNNILYQPACNHVNRANIRMPPQMTMEGALIKNNVFYNGNTNFTGFTFHGDSTHAVPPTLNNNLHYVPGHSGNILRVEATSSTWVKRAVGIETNGINADPFFASTVIPDFHILPSSPCRNAGAGVGLSQDYEGNSIWELPDIGAYELGPLPATTLPTVTTTVPLAIKSTSATGGGIVTSDGGGSVIDRGVCWSLATNPTLSNAHTHDGSGTGGFTSSLTTLSPETSYHIRAYATNSVGTAYGDDLVFVTGASSSTISLSRSRLSFGATSRGARTQSQSIIISFPGNVGLNWTATAQQPWIIISQTSGAGPTMINVGVDPSGLTSGTFPGQIAVVAPGASNSPRVINIDLTIYTLDSVKKPFGHLDTPQNGSTVSGSVPVTGWALDDIGVENVKIYRDPVGDDQPGDSGLVYIGEATFVEGARPDIEQIYSSHPMNYRAGWGLMVLTNGLPNQGNGTFVLHAKAVNKAGMQIELGTKTIICDNAHATKPFGAIDTPVQGGMISGNLFVNFGWVLTPLPNMIPIDGSTLTVWIDGKLIGQPVYNNYRADIAAAFPGYANSNGAVGYFNFDTTTYANGVHTIGWSAKDSAGNAEGIGSRFISIYNSGGTVSNKNDGFFSLAGNESDSVSLAELANIPNDAFSPMLVKNGFDAMTGTMYMYPEMDGAVRLKIHEVERLEILLDGQATKNGGEQYCGYLLSGNDMRSLPIGSTLDPINGVFTWQPGPGFLGEYKLVFVKKGTDRMLKKVLNVLIQPKFSH
jgi:parallel beta-helix repeat protein